MKSVTGLHVILGGMDRARLIELARIAEGEGAAVLQLREKTQATSQILTTADALRAILQKTSFIINDRADIALATGADGVHLGQDDLPIEAARSLLGPDALIGVSTSNVEEALVAEKRGANYIGFGHMFPTRSKEKPAAPRSLEELKAVIAAVSIPVIAIGGITPSNVQAIISPGLGGVAVIGAIASSEEPRAVIRQFVRMLERQNVAIS